MCNLIQKIEKEKMAEESSKSSSSSSAIIKPSEQVATDPDNFLVQNRDDAQERKDPMLWIQEQIESDADPRSILKQLLPQITVPDHVTDFSVWRIVFEIISEPAPRKPLLHINSIEQVKTLIKESKNIIVLTGAGVSVSCGIPDFRSRDGIYARLSKDYPDLPNPQAMFDIHYFKTNQWPFFKFAKEIYPGQFTPSLCHRFIAHLDKTDRLLRNYSQNIDTLEQVAGIKNVVQCHGSFATASCMNCKRKVNAEDIKTDIFQEKIPYCKQCIVTDNLNVLKPDIVFFGENLPEAFHKQIEQDKEKADLLIVIGSSLKVRPVSLIPNLLKADVPQILINREPLNHTRFDVEFYGNCDDVICSLCMQLGDEWMDVVGSFEPKPIDSEKIETLIQEASEVVESDMVNNDEDAVSDTKLEGVRQSIDNHNKYENTMSKETIPVNCPCNEQKNDGHKMCKCGYRKNVDINSVKEPVSCSDQSKSVDELVSCSDLSKCVDEPVSCSDTSKRKHENDEGVEHSKKMKTYDKAGVLEETNEEIYYMSIPPNRYIFYGAEINFDNDSSDSESYCGDNVDTMNNDVTDVIEQPDSVVETKVIESMLDTIEKQVDDESNHTSSTSEVIE